MGVSQSVQGLDLVILNGFVCLLIVLVVLFKAVKAPPPSLKWRGMTVSSLFSHPVVPLLIIVGIAIVVTCILHGVARPK